MNKELILARKLRGFSQKEFAQMVAMDQSTYSRKENGKNLITIEEWKRMAKALDLDVNDIQPENHIVFKNENCTFNENSVGVKYVNVPEDILESLIKYTKILEKEIDELKKRNSTY